MINVKILALALLIFIIALLVCLWYFFSEKKEQSSFMLHIPTKDLYLYCEESSHSTKRIPIKVRGFDLILQNYQPRLVADFKDYQSQIITQSRDLLNLPKKFQNHQVVRSEEEPTLRGFARYLYQQINNETIQEIRIRTSRMTYIYRLN